MASTDIVRSIALQGTRKHERRRRRRIVTTALCTLALAGSNPLTDRHREVSI